MLEASLAIEKFLRDLRRLRLTKDDNITSAIIALRTAIRETRNQINTKGYQPSNEISDLWLDAYRAFQKARMKNRMLYDKARFWEDPKLWINEPSTLELIPTLNQLERECENLLV